jgi:hypothetical protein
MNIKLLNKALSTVFLFFIILFLVRPSFGGHYISHSGRKSRIINQHLWNY